MFAWFSQPCRYSHNCTHDIHADFNKHHKMSLHLHEKSTIICGKNYGQKKVTIDYCAPYSTPQRGMNIDPKVLVWKITCTQTIPSHGLVSMFGLHFMMLTNVNEQSSNCMDIRKRITSYCPQQLGIHLSESPLVSLKARNSHLQVSEGVNVDS